MELDSTAVAHVKCCMCGLVIESNPSNMCPNCIRAHIDITEGLIREYIIVYCPECERYLQPPKYWSRAELESRELMTICLKKVRGLAKYNLVNAVFLWTEPHSKQLKLKLDLQKEIFANTVIQQTVQIDYTVHWMQCERCQKAATGQPQWDAVVQLRQKADHKRTFLYLEQLILKHRMHEDVTRIESHPDGLDFYFGHKSHANSFVDFLGALAPIHRTDARQLVSHDSKNNTAVEHHTFSIDIATVCREDLVCLPKFYYNKMGGLGPLVIVHKVYSSIVFLDPKTLRANEVTGTLYWKNIIHPLAATRQLLEFYVIDVRLTGVVNGKFHQADVEVCLSSEVGGDRTWIVPTHLGKILSPGDYAKGYLLESINFNNDDIGNYKDEQIPSVVIVRKHYADQAKRRHLRRWKLRKLDVDDGGVTKQDRHDLRKDEDEFLDDLERDRDFRKDIPLYKEVTESKPQPVAADEEGDAIDAPQVDLSELLDELAIEGEGYDDDDQTANTKRQREIDEESDEGRR